MFGEPLDAQIAGDILGNPVVQRRETVGRIAVRGRGLRFERCGKLRLPAGAIEKDDEMPRHVHGDFAPEILLDQSEAQIDPGGDAG